MTVSLKNTLTNCNRGNIIVLNQDRRQVFDFCRNQNLVDASFTTTASVLFLQLITNANGANLFITNIMLTINNTPAPTGSKNRKIYLKLKLNI